MDQIEEQNLIKKARDSRDPEAFGVLYDYNYDSVFGYVLKRTGHYQIAEDVTSEVFKKALDKLWQFRWKSIRLSAWLYRIASNEIIDYYRKNNKLSFTEHSKLENTKTSDSLEQEIMEAQDELERQGDYQRLKTAISKLDHKYQEVVTLMYFQKMSVREISEALGKKEGTVKSILSRSYDKLLEILNATE